MSISKLDQLAHIDTRYKQVTGVEPFRLSIGSVDARVMVLTESLLTDVELSFLSETFLACGIDLESVFFSSVVKHEVNAWADWKFYERLAPFVREELRCVWPDVILGIGVGISRFVLHSEQGVEHTRNKIYKVGHFDVLITYHVALGLVDKLVAEQIKSDVGLLAQVLQKGEQS